MSPTILKPGDKVKLNDEGIDVVSGFCRNRRDAALMLGELTVEHAEFTEVTDDNGDPIEGFQDVDLVEFPALLDNTQMILVSRAN